MTSIRFIYIILSAFIAGVLLLVFIQYNSSRSIDQLIEGNRLLLNEMKSGNDLRETERDILSVEGKIRAAVATGDSSFLEGVDSQIAAVEANLDTMRQLDPDPASGADIILLATRTHEKLHRKDFLLDSFLRPGKRPPSSLITDIKAQQAAVEINSVIRNLYAIRKDRLATVIASVQKYGQIARTTGIILISLVLLGAGAILWFTIDRIRRQNDLIRRLDASERNLQDAVRIKENFLANMSHEIRTPLNSIIGFTGLLSKQPLNDLSREFATAIGTSGENLLSIVNDILDLSKLEAGMMRVEARPFSVRELFRSVETLFRHRVKEKGLYLRPEISAETPDILMGDPTRLTQITVNLVGNALKFTDTGGIMMTVSSRNTSDETILLQVEVRDTGIGISQQQKAAIFDRFTQAESSTTRKYGGTGLGLAIVKELITLQQGDITVESEPGRGATFRFCIPYQIVEAIPPVASPAVPPRRPQTTGARILVADDNRMNLKLLEHLLSGAGYSFDMVSDGHQVIDRLRQNAYDLVLMDIQMPGMDGYTASRLIRDELRLTLPIVGISAHALPGEREKCLASGMNDYLPKPIVEAELFRVIAATTTPAVTTTPPAITTSGATHTPTATPPPTTAATKSPQAAFRFIDTTYLHELSGGDIGYELEMTEQFLQSLPAELEQLGAALAAGDSTAASRLAHNLKTTVSIMGLAERLYVLLDALEYPDGFTDRSALFLALQQVCGLALEEARRFRPAQSPYPS